MADDAREREECPPYNAISKEGVVNDLDELCQEVDQFNNAVEKPLPLHIPKYVDQFLDKLESKLEQYEPVESSNKFGLGSSEDVFMLISSIQRLAKLVKSKPTLLEPASTTAGRGGAVLNRGSSLLHRAMVVLEEQAMLILEQWKGPPNKNYVGDPQNNNYIKGGGGVNINMRRRLTSFKSGNQRHHQDNSTTDYRGDQGADSAEQQQQVDGSSGETFPTNYSAEDMSMMSLICKSMMGAGYTRECVEVFETTRRGALEEELRCQGMVEKMSVEEVQRMQWESLEGEIGTWMRILKRCSSHLLPCELRFYQVVFQEEEGEGQLEASSPSPSPLRRPSWKGAYSNHVRNVIQQLVSFAHAVAITPKSSEKLFKFLDMYESLRELSTWMDSGSGSVLQHEVAEGLRTDIGATMAQLGEAAVSIFCDLESSIRNDNPKQPVPSGAVHPLIRYTMNYLKYAASEYKPTLDYVFHTTATSTSPSSLQQISFSSQLLSLIDLLGANLEAKSQLYKDPSLRYLFLMNNGRYMLQKIRGSPDLRQAVGDTWYRKKSSQMRTYHKSYQRDTWAKVLHCISPEGLHVNTKLQKPILKDRFKSFNQLFDDIHKTQSTWVVSDDQLKSELRVSISAVMIPAYRAFLARFSGVFTPGRQYEKYVKYQPDDIEAVIEDLFDGTPTSMSRRRT